MASRGRYSTGMRPRVVPLVLAASLLSPAVACRRGEPQTDDTEARRHGAQAEDPTLDPIPDEGPLPDLRRGQLDPVEGKAVVGKVLVSQERGGARYLEFELPTDDGLREALRVHVDELDGVYALAWPGLGRGTTVVLRRAGLEAWPSSIEGTLWIVRNVEDGGTRWHRLRFEVDTSVEAPAGSGSGSGSGAVRRWQEDLWEEDLAERYADHFPSGEVVDRWSFDSRHPWFGFASARLLAMGEPTAEGGETPALERRRARARRTELGRLMGTVTASTSIQEALQYDRGLRLREGRPERSVPLAELEGPPLDRHPFAAMRAALDDPDGGIAEPLAALTPAEFWYLRFADIRLLLRTLDEADAWVTPVVAILQSNAEHLDLAGRYQAQLGLRRSALAKTLGHTVVAEIAVVGSDPYLREGSDLTLIFEAANLGMLTRELEAQLELWRAEVPGVERSSIVHGTHTIVVDRDPLGLVRRHQVTVGERVLVSNSLAAITRVLDTVDGEHDRLSEEPDLKFMLARDGRKHDALAFFSDRFIESVVGPVQKIGQSRRQQALTELNTPGYAALLYGALRGVEPETTQALIDAGMLGADELAHADGSPISFEPGQAAHSRFGRVAALTPLIDLTDQGEAAPDAGFVTQEERDAYVDFALGYQDNWTTFIDPVALTLDMNEGPGGAVGATIAARVLPVIEASDFDDIREVVGRQRVLVPPLRDGVQMVWALGADSSLRRELDQAAASLGEGLGLSWLGDWVSVGSLDRRALLDLAWYGLDDVQLPSPEGDESEREIAKRVGRLPIFAMVEVGNPAALVVTLASLKALTNSVAPGMLAWGEHSRHGEVAIVKIGAGDDVGAEFRDWADAVALYYAQTEGTLIVALREDVLKLLIDRAVRGDLPESIDPKAGASARGELPGAQYVVEGRSAPDRALWSALAWSLQAEANNGQGLAREAAEAVLRGAPSTQGDQARFEVIARAYLGSVPVTASGQMNWSLAPEGVSDPVHGSEVIPRFPALPVPGSPIAALMDRLVGIRGEVSFEPEAGSGEPPAQSLRTSFEIRF